MIQITKGEMEYLVKRGYKFEETIHRSHSDTRNGNHYWMTTDYKPMRDLEKYRKKHVVETYTGK